MKAFRVVALGALLLVAGAAMARAQGGGAQQDQTGRRPDRLLENMMLTAAQKAKIEGINRKYQPEMQAIIEAMNTGGDRAEVNQRRSSLFARMQPEIRAVLTPDQAAIFDKNVAEMKLRMEQMSRPR